MSKFKDLGDDSFVIAEVGQNHQGCFDTALEYIGTFAKLGANAIKFQTRDNKFLFSEEAYGKHYDSENSFGETYGEHREALELDVGRLGELKSECKTHDVAFMSTPFDEPSLERLTDVGVDVLKIASFDLGNLPLIHQIAKTGLPIVLSVGGGKMRHIKESVETICEFGEPNIAILHCVSEYPCAYNKLGLNNIPLLQEEFPFAQIGLSDHFNGILSGPIAYMKGARVFEKHVTFNRSLKGTDHSFALEPEGFRKFARDIKRVNKMMPIKAEKETGNEPVFKKLGKSIAATVNIPAGSEIKLGMVRGIIDVNDGIPIRDVGKIIGKIAACDIQMHDIIRYNDVIL